MATGSARRSATTASAATARLASTDPAALRASVRPQADDVGVAAFSTLAAELGVYLLIGSLAILRSDGQIANRSFLFAPDGHIAAQYDKIHLFEANLSEDETYREADSYAAGDIPVMTKVDDVTLGLSICYDLRFPELYRAYGQAVDKDKDPEFYLVDHTSFTYLMGRDGKLLTVFSYGTKPEEIISKIQDVL